MNVSVRLHVRMWLRQNNSAARLHSFFITCFNHFLLHLFTSCLPIKAEFMGSPKAGTGKQKSWLYAHIDIQWGSQSYYEGLPCLKASFKMVKSVNSYRIAIITGFAHRGKEFSFGDLGPPGTNVCFEYVNLCQQPS